jgi:hypothetical protein
MNDLRINFKGANLVVWLDEDGIIESVFYESAPGFSIDVVPLFTDMGLIGDITDLVVKVGE